MSNGNGNGNAGTAIQKQTPKAQMVSIQQILETRKEEFAKALPKHLTVERLLRVALTCIAKTPDLQTCSGASLCGAILQCAELGLEPGGALGHAYLVPYKQTCTLIIGYRGLIELARRSGELAQIEAHVVYSGDTCELEFGLTPKLRHVPKLSGDRGQAVFAYCVARMADGAMHVETMTVPEIEAVRSRSKAGKSGPWVTDWAEMARKTVVRRATKYLPLSSEKMARALEVADAEYVDGEVVDQAAAPLPAGVAGVPPTSKTQAVKERVAKRVQVVDVQPGETSEEAIARGSEPPADQLLPGQAGYSGAEPPPPSDADAPPAGGAQ